MIAGVWGPVPPKVAGPCRIRRGRSALARGDGGIPSQAGRRASEHREVDLQPGHAVQKAGHDAEVVVLTEPGHYASVTQRMRSFDPDVVGFSSVSSQFIFVKELATFIKKELSKLDFNNSPARLHDSLPVRRGPVSFRISAVRSRAACANSIVILEFNFILNNMILLH